MIAGLPGLMKVAVVYFTAHGLLVTAANIIAAGARKVRPCLAGGAFSTPHGR